jgi:hypothetical protein
MRLPSVAFALFLTACGGSASETPFPVEPVPEYARAASERTSAEPSKPGSAAPTQSDASSKPAQRRAPSASSGPVF